MNDKIKDAWEKAAQAHSGDSWAEQTAFLEKFAELIVRECSSVVSKKTGPKSALNVLEHFGLEESKGWVCPKCSADRTKVACPLGFDAQVDGRCPMTVEAQ